MISPIGRVKPTGLRAVVVKKATDTFQVTGILALPLVPTAAMCDGSVRLVVKIQHKQKKVVMAELAPAKKHRKGCRFSAEVRVQTSPLLTQRVRAIFDGTPAIFPARGHTNALPR